MGCFLFQLPPGYRYSEARLAAIVDQLDPKLRNVLEFRHASWWNQKVYTAFRQTGTIFLFVQRASVAGRTGCTTNTLPPRRNGMNQCFCSQPRPEA